MIAVGAFAVLGQIANFGDLRRAAGHADRAWFPVCALGELLAYVGYIAGYRVIARAEGGPALDVWTATRVVALGFGASVIGSAAGTLALDFWALERAGERPHQAARRVLALNTLEWAVLAVFAACAGAALLAGAGKGAPTEMSLAWIVVVPVCLAAAAWFTSPSRVERFARLPEDEPDTQGRARDLGYWARWAWTKARKGFADAIGAVAFLRRFVAHPRRNAVGLLAFALYWIGGMLTLYAALRAFGETIGPAALVLGYTTVSRSVDLRRASEMARENATLATSLSGLQGRLDLLEDTLSAIAERDRRIRLLANLEPHDPQVLQAGVGGSLPPRASGSEVVRQATSARAELNTLIRRANLLAASFTEARDSLQSHAQRLESMPSILPTSGWLSSAFAAMRRHPILHISRPHEGLDITAPTGTPIEAPGAGTVTNARWESGYGQTVTVDHGYGIVTKYAHASKLLVRRGQRVKRGDRIALVGNSGLATGPHLHYEVHVNGRPVDPLRYVLPDVITE